MKKYISIFIIIVIFITFSSSVLATGEDITITMSDVIYTGNEFNSIISINNFYDIYGISIDMKYDASYITVSSVELGSIFADLEDSVVKAVNEIDNVNGDMHCVWVLTGEQTNVDIETLTNAIIIKFNAIGNAENDFSVNVTNNPTMELDANGVNTRILAATSNANAIFIPTVEDAVQLKPGMVNNITNGALRKTYLYADGTRKKLQVYYGETEESGIKNLHTYDKNGVRIAMTNYHTNGNRITMTKYHANGKAKYKYFYNTTTNVKKSMMSYNEAGVQIAKTEYYANGASAKRQYLYYASGKKKIIKNFRTNKKLSSQTWFYTDGTSRKQFNTYDANGKLTSVSKYYKNGKRYYYKKY